jgi:hypothetical protein
VRSGIKHRRNRFVGDLRVFWIFGIVGLRIHAFGYEQQRLVDNVGFAGHIY